MRRVLFLCTGNSARSQMSEAWAKHVGAGIAEYHSAGTRPSAQINPYAIAVMAERGATIEPTKPKHLDSIPQPVDLIVAVCSNAAEECPVPPPGTEVRRWDLADPTIARGAEEEILAVFRASRDEIERHVRSLVTELSS